jgi:hypothetical protein
LPGVIGPTLLGQRYGMDGGICSNAAHVDVVAGSKRAIVITITDGLTPPFYTGVPHRHADKGLNPDLKVIFASYSDALGERASIDLSTDSQQRDLHQDLWSHAHWAARVEADQQFF